MADEEGRCGSCKHWEQRDAEWSSSIRLTLAEGEDPESRYDHDSPHQERVRRAESLYGLCNAITLLDSYAEITEEELPLAFTRDASDYVAKLYTQRAFGCPLWAGR